MEVIGTKRGLLSCENVATTISVKSGSNYFRPTFEYIWPNLMKEKVCVTKYLLSIREFKKFCKILKVHLIEICTIQIRATQVKGLVI